MTAPVTPLHPSPSARPCTEDGADGDRMDVEPRFRSDEALTVALPDQAEELILSALPYGSTVVAARHFDNYDLPCPIRVTARAPDGRLVDVVLRSDTPENQLQQIGVERELASLGLSVPEVLADPTEGLAVVSLLGGEDLQHFSMRSPQHLTRAKALLVRALTTFEEISADLESRAQPGLLQHRSLPCELEQCAHGGPWVGEPLFDEAVSALRPLLVRIVTPLTFTNGDHQPANFLTDGETVTGYLDFEGACFRDPLMGVAKYPVYDLHPLNKAGFVAAYLEARGFTQADLAPRLALMCLKTLQKEVVVAPDEPDDRRYRDHVLRLLRESLSLAEQNGAAT